MSIKRYVASKDTTITNSYKNISLVRGVDANMGESDSLEIFSLYDQYGDKETETSRVLLEFPIEKIVADRQEEKIPEKGKVNFILKMNNAVHPNTVPKKYNITVNALSRQWEEGNGLDMESYADIGTANWISASSTSAWTTEGGDYYQTPEFFQYFDNGTEDLSIDVTEMVENWIDQSVENNGIIVKLSSSLESDENSYYSKKFFSRGSEFFYKRPWIEARFDASIKDDRGRFYMYNPFVPDELSYNSLYIYNTFKGSLVDLPQVGRNDIYVRLYENPNLPVELTGPDGPLTLLDGTTVATGSWVSTGIYKVSLAIDTNLEKVYDIWFDALDNPIGVGGEIPVINPDGEEIFTRNDYVITIKNLKSSYHKNEEPRFYAFIRSKSWNPNIYTSVATTTSNTVVDEMYYKVFRISDNLEIIPYGIDSTYHTRLSYDKNGNYFDLDMSLFEPGYAYGIKFLVSDMDYYYESDEIFKFRVEE